MTCISAFTVDTEPRGFNVCTWPATSRKQAEAKAKELSLQLKDDPNYPNAFWVCEAAGDSLGKWFRGKRYERGQSV